MDFYLNNITDGAAKALLDQRALMIKNMDKDSFKKLVIQARKLRRIK